MATYIYETIPSSHEESPERFEIQQSMNDEPLTRHPDTGAPVRRVITGGYGFNVSGSQSPSPAVDSGCCHQGGCGCSHN